MNQFKISVVLLVLLISCGRFSNEEKKEEQTDRIVSAAKQYTEIMYALGVGDKLVAVDISSTYPPEVKELPTIGYHMHLSFEGIMATKPTLLLEHGGKFSIGPEAVVDQLKKLQIPTKQFETKAVDIASTKQLIREMGIFFNATENVDSICKKLDNDMAIAQLERNKYSDTVKVIVIHYGQAMNIYMAVGADGTAGKMIEWAGGIIPLQKHGMERITSPEIIAKANPDVILLTDFGYDKLGSMEQILELPGIGLTNAAKNGKIYRVEEHDLIYFGPRTGENILKLQQLIHQ
ncbi:ABC transporter substrate-binding protein [bacterium]|nr:ABC transporter substrate-binding protein [bacterium]